VPYNEKCLQYLRSRQANNKMRREDSLEHMEAGQHTSTSEDTDDSDKESGVTQIEVRTTTTTTTMTKFAAGSSNNKIAAVEAAALRAKVEQPTARSKESLAVVGGGAPEATYLRMDRAGKATREDQGGPPPEAVKEAVEMGEADSTSDITEEEDDGRNFERPEEIDASTERYFEVTGCDMRRFSRRIVVQLYG
jgi:hypothetical protein